MATPPATESELLSRARGLAGKTLGDVAAELGRPVPLDLLREKGFAGRLLEDALGATAGSRAAPDFEHLGIELKTLPVDSRGNVLETTFVCTIALRDVGDVEWEQSPVRLKLARVLWMPVNGERTIAVHQRRIGMPLLWSPSAEDDQVLRWDWDELSGLIGQGRVEDVTGHLGRALQVRPKAANGRSRRLAYDAEGCRMSALPRGFYLRTSFTQGLVRKHFALG
jgi:DNA mismatch repair protein MutH